MKKEAAQRTEAENKAKQASEGENTFWSRLHFWKSKKEAAVAKSAKPFHPIVEGPIEEQIPDRSQGRSAFQAEKSSAAPAARAEAEESPPESAATPATPLQKRAFAPPGNRTRLRRPKNHCQRADEEG